MISDFFDELETAVQAWIPECKFAFGGLEPDTQEVPPRVCWVPSEDRFEGTDSNGRSWSPDEDNSVLTVKHGFVLHIWGDDYEDTMTLYRRVLLELYHVAGGWRSYRLDKAAWVTHQKPDWMKDGTLVLLSIQILTPLLEDPEDYATVKVVDLDCTDTKDGDGIIGLAED